MRRTGDRGSWDGKQAYGDRSQREEGTSVSGKLQRAQHGFIRMGVQTDEARRSKGHTPSHEGPENPDKWWAVHSGQGTRRNQASTEQEASSPLAAGGLRKEDSGPSSALASCLSTVSPSRLCSSPDATLHVMPPEGCHQSRADVGQTSVLLKR